MAEAAPTQPELVKGARTFAWTTFAVAVIAIWWIGVQDGLLPVLKALHVLGVPWLKEPLPEEIHYCQSWFLAGLVVNAISIGAAIYGLYKVSKEDRSPILGVVLGCLLALNIAAVFLVRYHNSTIPTVVAMALFAVYCLMDARNYNVARSKQRNTAPFMLPFVFIDLPSLIITIFFAYYTTKPGITIEFSAGATAGVLLSSSLVYIAMSGFVFKETTQ